MTNISMRQYRRAVEGTEKRAQIEEDTQPESQLSPRERFKLMAEEITEEDNRLELDPAEASKVRLSEMYLPIEDRVVIRRGLSRLLEYLESLSSEKLPEMVVFPDTTSRALFYAVSPVLQRVYEQRGAERPKFRFLVTWSDHNQELTEGFSSREEAEVLVEERIEEIMSEVKDQGNILVVDDYLDKGATLDQIDRLFGEAARKRGSIVPKTDFFCLLWT